ncbi:MAG: tRNA (N6-threonylcarbamoyladenosine(37)-N6)-methyltransferase TrmO [Synechococcales cyanobacterium CRU_2_2]|nr:tRNA (N6-threonylcarbamoyladenosine(37)-N6)-methyltransferase TrmO [Synechococcales cyanobacterium CRU_2_2]
MPKLPQKRYIQAVEFPHTITMQPIGIIHSPYTERHGTPRQSQLRSAPADYRPAIATLVLFEEIVPAIALQDLAGFDYIWVISWLHLNRHWNPTVTPPRGPKVKRGTLATRAPHRPNPIGLSAVRLRGVEGNRLHLQGIDLLDQTPVLDIKPYVSYCDAFPEADCGYVSELERDRDHEEDVFGDRRPEIRPT